MELAILGAVGLLGYVMSEKDARPSGPSQPLPTHQHAYPWGPGTEVGKLLEADRQVSKGRWEQSLEPHVTGVVAPNAPPGARQPFFRSAKSQHTNNDIKQRRMEMFTGAVGADTSQTGTWRKKTEVPSMFKPEWTASAVTSSGKTAGTPYGIDQAAHYFPSIKLNGLSPTQQVLVGPGVGVGTDVPAADGFHPMLRVMPKNVNEYRKNNLPGALVVGGSTVATRPQDPRYTQQGPPRFWDQARRPTEATKASVLAASERPEQELLPCGGRMIGEDWLGPGGRVGSYVGVTQATRDRQDANFAMHDTNVTGARHGVGTYAKATFDTTRVDSQRREQFQEYEGVLTGGRAPTAKQTYLLADTNRAIHDTGYEGNPASAVEGGKARPMDAWDRTLREGVHTPAQLGVAAPYIKGFSVQATDKWLDRESKRYGQHLVDYMPPAHSPQDVRVPGLVQVKPRLELAEAPALPTNPTPLAMAPMGARTDQVKRRPENTRLDLGIAASQLANNPLHLKVS